MSRWDKNYKATYHCETTYKHRHDTIRAEGLLEAMVVALGNKRHNEVVSTVKEV
jgi:hypothetical protein